jgi:hypothetical protein
MDKFFQKGLVVAYICYKFGKQVIKIKEIIENIFIG